MSDLGRVLLRHLAVNGMSRAELARRSGLNATQVTRILTDETRPTAETLRQLHAGTGIPLTALIVASGMFTAAELGTRVATPVAGEHLTNEELLELVRERMAPAAETSCSVATATQPTVVSGPDEPTGRVRPQLVSKKSDAGSSP